MEALRYVDIDRGDYVERAVMGIVVNKNGFVMMAGGEIPDEQNMLVHLPWGTRVTCPNIIFKYPKKVPENMTREQLMVHVFKETVKKFIADFKEACLKDGLTDPPPQGLGESSNARNQIDQEHQTNILDMKELDSALDNCAKGNCAECKGTESFDDRIHTFSPDNLEI